MTTMTLNLNKLSSIDTKTIEFSSDAGTFVYTVIAATPINVRAVLADALGIRAEQVTNEMLDTGYGMGLDYRESYEVDLEGNVAFAHQFTVSNELSQYV